MIMMILSKEIHYVIDKRWNHSKIQRIIVIISDLDKTTIELAAHNLRIALIDARRLIAARDALIEDYPYVVSIQKERQHWCAGALLNPKLVITTANCLWK